jgi:DNA polymerase-3 subunit beta
MKLTVTKETLLLALNRTQGIVGKKTTMPILSNVLIETTATDRFTVTATDLDIFAKGEYAGIVDKPGKLCMNARDLHEITRNLPAGAIRLELTDDKKSAKVTSGSITYKIRTTEVDDYPAMPDFGKVEYTTLGAQLLHELIEHTLFSVANDDPRIFLNGVNLETPEGKLRMVSTDGHRLSLIDRDVEGLTLAAPVIIPRKGLIELRKLLDEGGETMDLAFTGSNGFFKRDDLLLVMRLIEGEFPDYNMVIPKKGEKVVMVAKSAFADALRRMAILSSERSYGVRFNIAPGQIRIESSDPEKGEGRELLEVAYGGPELSIGFNAKYFQDALNVVEGDTVQLELSDELSPCVVRDASDDGFLCVVMPVRIS